MATKKSATRYEHIMIDNETLGTRADSVILSIGAVKFNLSDDQIDAQGFYGVVEIDSNHEYAPRNISGDTLKWWMQQGQAAKSVFAERKSTLDEVLHDLAGWVDHDNYQVWGNGSDFDIAMLTHAYGTHKMPTPWKFWNTRCFRTIKNLPNTPPNKTPPTVAHNALADALSQAQHLQQIWKEVIKKGK